MTTYSDVSPASRVPGRCWTVRVDGHADRTATVTCARPEDVPGAPCRIPPRFPDTAAARAFAAAHAAAHARLAMPRPDALCRCQAGECAWHEGSRVVCAGDTVLLVRADPAVNRLWQVAEVCSRCSSHIPHSTMVSVAARPGRNPAAPAVEPAGRPMVAGGFSSGGLPPAEPGSGRPPRRSSRPPHPPHRRGSH